MVLYYGFSTYHILASMVHRLKYHREEKAILLIPYFVLWKLMSYKKITELGLFDELYFFDFVRWRDACIQEDVNKEEVDLLYKETLPYEITDFDEIIVCATHWPFAIFLAINNIHFTYMEDACGIYIHRNNFIDIYTKAGNPFFVYGAKYGLIDATSPLVDLIYAHIPQGLICDDHRVKNFHVCTELDELPKNDFLNISAVFGLDNPFEMKLFDKILVLTAGLSNCKMMSNNQQLEMYALVLDYCFDGKGNVVFKLHPDDLNPYDKIFECAELISGAIPVELLCKNPMNHVVAINSTGMNGIEAKEKMTFYDFFWDEYDILHKYNVVKELVEVLQSKCYFSFYTVGGREEIFSNIRFAVLHEEDCLKDENNKIVYIGPNIKDVQVIKDIINQKDWVLIFDSFDDTLMDVYRGSKYEIFSKGIEIIHSDGKNEKQNIYIISDTDAYIDTILDFQYVKELRFAKENVVVKKMDYCESKNQAMYYMLNAIKQKISGT